MHWTEKQYNEEPKIEVERMAIYLHAMKIKHKHDSAIARKEAEMMGR